MGGATSGAEGFNEVAFAGAHKDGPRVLALDGAGFVRIYSSLEILDAVVKEVSKKTGVIDLKPYQCFDLICGTGIGGLVAILLGRLRMSVDDCRQELCQLEGQLESPHLVENIFSPVTKTVRNAIQSVPIIGIVGNVISFAESLAPPLVGDTYARTVGWALTPDACKKQNSERLKEWLAKIVQARYRKSSMQFEEEVSDSRCRTFILASPKETPSRPHRIRAYTSRIDTKCTVCSIVEVGAAATALSLEFHPTPLGSSGIEYMEAGLGYGNPSREALDETRRIWSTQPRCLINIGVGGEDEPSFQGTWDLLGVGKFICLDRNRVARELFQEVSTMRLKYFRFDVEEIRSDALDWLRKQHVLELTRNYLEDQSQKDLIKLCSQFLVQDFRDGSSIECFSYKMTADTSLQRASSESSTSSEYSPVSSGSSLRIRDQGPAPKRLKPQPRQGHTIDGDLLFDTIDWSEKPATQAISAASTWFEHLEKRAYPALNALKTQSKGSKIRGIMIAVLDTGIDLDHPSIAKRSVKTRMEYKDFTGTQPQDISDNVGHGTHVADTLLQVSPDNIQIFIAKIVDSRHFTEATAGHIADAIEYAVNNWKVDIITMSLGFKGRQPKIEKAIKLAGASDVLIFAAAANHGALDQVAFPARMNGVFAINSADGHGAKSAFTPRPRNDNDNFSVLGEAVRAAWPLSLISGGFAYSSGTSHATPVAVGIAALVLEFYKRSVGHEEHPIYKRLRSYEGMAQVFRRMMVIDRAFDGYTWLCPSALLQLSEHRKPSDIAKAIAHELGRL